MLHVSTDEVFGHLGSEGFFTPDSPYRPKSPYSATEALSDLIIRAWQKTFNLPILTTNCSYNFGLYQHSEKLIPKSINAIINNQEVLIYGDGSNVRNWLYVNDHVDCLIRLLYYSGSVTQF